MKILLKIVLALTLIIPQANAHEKTLYESLKPYLSKTGIIKEEYLVRHSEFRDLKGISHYNEKYLVKGIEIILQYDFTGDIDNDELGTSYILNEFPSAYRYRGIWWGDRARDGINGNEIKMKPEEILVPEGEIDTALEERIIKKVNV